MEGKSKENGGNDIDNLISADFAIFSTTSTINTTKLIIGFNTAITQNGLTSGSAIDFTGAGISASQGVITFLVQIHYFYFA